MNLLHDAGGVATCGQLLYLDVFQLHCVQQQRAFKFLLIKCFFIIDSNINLDFFCFEARSEARSETPMYGKPEHRTDDIA